MMFAGINGDEVLYTTDITGNYLKYNANAIGENDEAIKTLLREKYTKGLSKKKAVELALEIFKEVQRDNFSVENFDAGILEEGKITKVSGRKLEDFD